MFVDSSQAGAHGADALVRRPASASAEAVGDLWIIRPAGLGVLPVKPPGVAGCLDHQASCEEEIVAGRDPRGGVEHRAVVAAVSAAPAGIASPERAGI